MAEYIDQKNSEYRRFLRSDAFLQNLNHSIFGIDFEMTQQTITGLNNRSIRKRCEICLKLTIKAPKDVKC